MKGAGRSRGERVEEPCAAELSRAGRRAGRFCALFCSLLLALAPRQAGAGATARFGRLSVEDGLSQNSVQAILQDHVGFLWFGTEEGLSRFDGYGMTLFEHDAEDPASLPHNRVTALFEDREQRLWIGTDAGLARFDHRRQTFVREGEIGQRVNAVAEDGSGWLWVAVEGGGLYARDPGSGSFTVYQKSDDDPTSLGSWLPSAVLVDREGAVWVGTKDRGVDRLVSVEGEVRFVHYRHDDQDPGSLSHNEVWGLAEDADGRIWVATYGGGLNVLDPAASRFRHYRAADGGPHPLGSDQVTTVFVDRAGTVWAGTDGAGLQQHDPTSDGFIAYRHDPGDAGSISSDVIRCLYQDRQGQLWAGTFLEGASHLRKARYAFSYFTHNPMDSRTLSNGTIYAFLEDARGSLWVSTAGGWLHRRRPGADRFERHMLPDPEHGALSLHLDRSGRFWIGTYRGGLLQLDPERGAVVGTHRNRLGDASSLSNDEVWAIAEDDEGMLWLGTNDGLDRFDPVAGKVVERYDTPGAAGAINAGVRALLHDQQGNLWVGSLGGLFRRSRGASALERIRPEDSSLQRDGVVALLEDDRGRIWTGTYGGGLKRFDPRTGALGTFHRLPSNVVYGVQQDSRGRVWLSTNRGLARLDPERGSVDTFDLANGLQSLQFSLGASYRTRAGHVLFGSADGFYEFDPDGIATEDYAPPVVLTGVRLVNERMPLEVAPWAAERITLSPDDKVVTFEFAALDFVLPKRNRYACRLTGFSDRWLELGSRHEVTLTNLDPGRYRFEVKASNGDSDGSLASTTGVAVVVQPAFWATWWFRSLVAAALALLLGGCHRARLRQVNARWVERQRAELALREAQEESREIFENAAEGMFEALPEGRLATANPALARMLGAASPADLLASGGNLDAWLTVEPDRRREFLRLLGREGHVKGFECELCLQDGSRRWISASVRGQRDAAGAVVRYEGTVQDISERKRSEEQIQFKAYHDALTGLPNRRLLQDRLAQSLAYARRRRGILALFWLDLDQFKLVNYTLGLAVGDRLLGSVGERLQTAVRMEDTVARVGGDEFLLLFPHLTSSDDAGWVAEKLLGALATPFSVDGHEHPLTASLGVALYPTDGQDPDTLLRNAEAAMRCAKESGQSSYQLYASVVRADAGAREG